MNLLDQSLDFKKKHILDQKEILAKREDLLKVTEAEILRGSQVVHDDIRQSGLYLYPSIIRTDCKTSMHDFPLSVVDGAGSTVGYYFSAIDEEIFNPICDGSDFEDIARVYSFAKTTKDTTGDSEIIYQYDLKELSSVSEILCTVTHFIKEEMAGVKGVISTIREEGQQNLNIGYCLLKDKNGEEDVYVVYLECFEQVLGKMNVYHLHCTRLPRKYKRNRFMLLKLFLKQS